MQKLVFINANGVELDLTSDPFGITEWEGFSADELNIQSQQVPFQDGGVYLDALLGERELAVTVAMNDGNDLEKRYRLRREMISKLNPKLGEGVLIYTNDFLSKQIHCIPQLPVFENHNSNDSGTPKASCSFQACNPYWEDLEETVVEIEVGLTSSITNNGDIPTQVKIEIDAESKNPIVMNRTTEQKIELNIQSENEILINTQQGQKSIIELKSKLVWEQGGVFQSSAYGQGKFLYVGTTGVVIEDIVSGKTEGFYFSVPTGYTGFQAFWKNGYWVILAQRSFHPTILYYGTDGENWKSITMQGTVRDLIYNKEMYIVVGDNGYIATSTNLEDWQTLTQQDINFYSITYSSDSDLFVAVGSNGKIITTSDFVSWTTQTSGVSTEIRKVIYTGIFVAITTGKVLYSTDATEWIVSALQDSTRVLLDICYGNGVYAVLGYEGYVYSSSDLAQWNRISIGQSETMCSLSYGGGVFVCATQVTRIIKKSFDGANWQVQYDWNFDILDVAIGENKIVCIDSDNNFRISSDWGKSWTIVPTGTTGLQYLSYAKGLFIATGSNGQIRTSEDGLIWTSRTSGLSVLLSNIRYFEETGKIVICTSSNGTFLYSDDGLTWQTGAFGINVSYSDITYGNGYYLVCGRMSNTTYILKSSNLTTWTYETNATVGEVKAITFNKQFVALSGNRIYASQDGDNWSVYKQQNMGGYVYNVLSIGDYIYAIGDFGIGYIKVNMYHPIQVASDTIYGFSYGNKKFVVVGVNGVVILSETEQKNVIEKMTTDSDLSLELARGNNNLSFFADTTGKSCFVSYRQKYIGV